MIARQVAFKLLGGTGEYEKLAASAVFRFFMLLPEDKSEERELSRSETKERTRDGGDFVTAARSRREQERRALGLVPLT